MITSNELDIQILHNLFKVDNVVNIDITSFFQ